VTTISGPVLTHHCLESVTIEEDNVHFRVIGSVPSDFGGKPLIRYFGSDTSVCRLRQIEGLLDYCFGFRSELQELCFGPGSLLTEIDEHVFHHCGMFSMIVIPADVRKIAGSAFTGTKLRSIEVARNSSHFRPNRTFLIDSDGGLVCCNYTGN
jgi:hypothetical protein